MHKKRLSLLSVVEAPWSNKKYKNINKTKDIFIGVHKSVSGVYVWAHNEYSYVLSFFLKVSFASPESRASKKMFLNKNKTLYKYKVK